MEKTKKNAAKILSIVLAALFVMQLLPLQTKAISSPGSESGQQFTQSDSNTEINSGISESDIQNSKYGKNAPSADAYVPEEIILKVNETKTLFSAFTAEELKEKYGITKLEKVDLSALQDGDGNEVRTGIFSSSEEVMYEATVSGDVISKCKELEKNKNVVYAEPDYIEKVESVPVEASSNTSIYQQQSSYYSSLGMSDVWNQGYTGNGVTVAVIDTGVDITHPDLIDNLWTNPNTSSPYIHGVNTVGYGEYSTYLGDTYGHGTHVAGIIAMDNDQTAQDVAQAPGVGIAPDAKIMVCKAAGYDGKLRQLDIIECVEFAIANNAQVINMSYGAYYYSAAEADIYSLASKKAVLVAGAGNDTRDSRFNEFYPAAYGPVIGVMAYGPNYGTNESLSSFSNYDKDGKYYQVAAPGSNITSARSIATRAEYAGLFPPMSQNEKYTQASGTSMASPMVAGVAALYLSKYPDADPMQVREAIINGSNTTVTGYDGTGTYKKINPNNILNQAPDADLLDSVDTTDSALINYVRAKLDKPTGTITKADALRMDTIIFNGLKSNEQKNFSKIYDLAEFKNLRYIQLNNTSVGSEDPGSTPSENILQKAIYLDLSGSNLTDTSFFNKIDNTIEGISLSNCNLTNADFLSSCLQPALHYVINLSNNKIVNFDPFSNYISQINRDNNYMDLDPWFYGTFISRSFITDVAPGTTVAQFKSNSVISNSLFVLRKMVIKIFASDGITEITNSDSALITTGTVVKLYKSDGTFFKEIKVVILGDVDCDGDIDSADAQKVTDLLLLPSTAVNCSSASICAADLNCDSYIDNSDIEAINNPSTINQNKIIDTTQTINALYTGFNPNLIYSTPPSVGTPVSTWEAAFSGYNSITATNMCGNTITDPTTELVTTGTSLILDLGSNKDARRVKFTAVIFGDDNGDGEITADDYGSLQAYLTGTSEYSIPTDNSCYLHGANINNDSVLNEDDENLFNNYLQGSATIDQRRIVYPLYNIYKSNTSADYMIDDELNIITGIPRYATAEMLLKNIRTEKGTIKILHKDNSEVSPNDIVGTGDIVKLFSADGSSVLKEYKIVIFGDVTGDGIINNADRLVIANDTNGSANFNTSTDKIILYAADIDRNGYINIYDSACIGHYLSDSRYIINQDSKVTKSIGLMPVYSNNKLMIKIDKNNGVITGVAPGTTVNQLIASLSCRSEDNYHVLVYDESGNITQNGSRAVATGCNIYLAHGNTIEPVSYNVVIFGDVDGDGTVGNGDAQKFRELTADFVTNNTQTNLPNYYACDVNDDCYVNNLDLDIIKNNAQSINQDRVVINIIRDKEYINIPPRTTMDQLLNYLNSHFQANFGKDDVKKSCSSPFIGTGTTVKYTYKYDTTQYFDESTHCTDIIMVVFGDVNGDGLINTMDVSQLVAHIVSPETYDAADLSFIQASDVNRDNIINAADVKAIYNKVSGKGAINNESFERIYYRIKIQYRYGVQPGTTAADFINSLPEHTSNMFLRDKNGTEITNTNTAVITTGASIKINNGVFVLNRPTEHKFEVKVVIIGDVNCDGYITQDDYTMLQNHVSGTQLIPTDNSCALLAADIDRDGDIDSDDCCLLNAHIKGVVVINQQKLIIN